MQPEQPVDPVVTAEPTTIDFRRRPRMAAPDWAGRGMKRRLFLLVGGLMLVLVMMEQVRNPELWRKIGFTEQPAGQGQPKAPGRPGEWTEIRLAPDEGDDRPEGDADRSGDQDSQDDERTQDDQDSLQPQEKGSGTGSLRRLRETAPDPGSSRRSNSWPDPEAFLPFDDSAIEKLGQDGDPDAVEAASKACREFAIRQTLWHPLLERLDADQLKAIAARFVAQESLPDDLATALTSVVEKLDVEVPRHSLEALESLSRQPESDARVAATFQFASYPEEWTAMARPWLLGDPAENHSTDSRVLDAFRHAFELVAWSRVVDRTGPARAEDAAATILSWCPDALFSGLYSTSPSVYELMTEPQKHRRRKMSWQGTLRGVEPVPSRPGILDDERIWALWVEPAEGGAVPLCVYSTEVPEGVAPNLRAFLSCEVPVNFVGTFFKLRTYTDTNRKQAVCPLIFAQSFSPVEKAEKSSVPLHDQGQSWKRLAVWLIPLLFVAAAASWMATAPLRKRRRHEPRGNREALRKLELDPSILSDRERVARFEQDRT